MLQDNVEHDELYDNSFKRKVIEKRVWERIEKCYENIWEEMKIEHKMSVRWDRNESMRSDKMRIK